MTPIRTVHTAPTLKIVKHPPSVRSDADLCRLIAHHHKMLLAAAARYVRDCTEMTWHDRARKASDLSGLYIVTIEDEAKK